MKKTIQNKNYNKMQGLEKKKKKQIQYEHSVASFKSIGTQIGNLEHQNHKSVHYPELQL